MKRLLPPALVLALALAGCAASGPPSPTKACDVELIEPMVAFHDFSLIEGLAQAWCDHPPAEHVMHVSVEWYRDGQWTAVPGISGRDHAECTEVPMPGQNVVCSQLVACIDGRYRTVVSVFGSGPSGPFNFLPPERPEATIKCPRP